VNRGLPSLPLRRGERRRQTLLISPALLVMTGFLLVPLAWTAGQSLITRDGHISLANYGLLFEDSAYFDSLGLTLRIAAIVTVICILLGYVVAYTMTLLPQWIATMCLVLVALPFWTSTLVRTYSWLVLLQTRGLINKWLMALGVIDDPLPLVRNELGVVIGMVHIMLPFMVFPLYATLRRIDPNQVRAAMGLGASATHAFWRVYLPQSLAGLSGGTVLVFVLSLGFYVTPAILGGGRTIMMALAIERDVNLNFNWGPASASGVLFVVVVLGIFAVLSRFVSIERIFQR
jgi:putative spermidine/putrescine transport system permease protein/spermidine/putrescine transport system permease protein